MRSLSAVSGFWRSVAFTLAVMALVLKVAVPPGMMVAKAPSAFSLVICTGHGPLTLQDTGKPVSPTHKSADTPCAFAGSAAPVVPVLISILTKPMALVASRRYDHLGVDLLPGRGLAAPPPPSHAPPEIPSLA